MIINVKSKEDLAIAEEILWQIGVDIENKVKVKVGKCNYRSIYGYIYSAISKDITRKHLLNQSVYILSPLAPSNNHYLKQSRWGNLYTPAETKKFQNMYADILGEVPEWKIPHLNIYLDTFFTFWFHRDDRDANNYFKVVFDICEKRLYENDKRTIPITRNIYIDGSESRQLMQMTTSDKIGVFPSLEYLQYFLNQNCLKCRKSQYKRRCSIINSLLENRLNPTITGDLCKCLEKTSK